MASSTARESSHGRTDRNTMETTNKERSTDREDSLTLPGRSTTVIGSTASRKATARFSTNRANWSRKATGGTESLRNDD